MARTLIIGIGNPLRRDDGLGWRAVERLRPRVSEAGVETIACHQLTPELAEAVARSERVLFIDACAGNPPGRLRVNRLMPGSRTGPALTHRLDPQGVMEYCGKLYGSWPEAFAISITGADYGYGEGLSAAVEWRLPALLDFATRLALTAAGGCQHALDSHALDSSVIMNSTG